MWAGLDDQARLRDVPNPWETVPEGEAPAVADPLGGEWGMRGSRSEGRPGPAPASSGRKFPERARYRMNRERELGLDRRETG